MFIISSFRSSVFLSWFTACFSQPFAFPFIYFFQLPQSFLSAMHLWAIVHIEKKIVDKTLYAFEQILIDFSHLTNRKSYKNFKFKNTTTFAKDQFRICIHVAFNLGNCTFGKFVSFSLLVVKIYPFSTVQPTLKLLQKKSDASKKRKRRPKTL